MFGKPRTKNQDLLSRYVDVTGDFSNRKLRWSGWYLKHKILFGQIGVNILIFFCVVTIGYSGLAWANYLFFGYQADERQRADQVAEFVDRSSLLHSYTAAPLRIDRPLVFQDIGNKMTFRAAAINPNERHIATVRYRFVYSGGQTEVKEALVFPDSQQLLVVFGHTSVESPRNVTLRIEAVSWERVNPHAIFDPAEYIAEKLAWSVDNFSFIRSSVLDDLPTHQILFAVRNDSVYSYWTPRFYVELLLDAEVVGVIPIEFEEFRAGETQMVNVRSLLDVAEVTGVRLIPLVNPFDESEVIPVGR